MKLKRTEIALLAVAAASVLFCAGYFTGRGSVGDISIITGGDTQSLREPLSGESGDRVSINSATREELMTIPGIGQALADRIIEYRDGRGGFEYVEELLNVYGIGESLFNKIKDYIAL